MKVKTQVDELVLASGEHPFHRLVQQLISVDPIKVVIAHNAEKSENASATSGGCSGQAVCFWPARQ